MAFLAGMVFAAGLVGGTRSSWGQEGATTDHRLWVGVKVDPTLVVNQHDYEESNYACGPSSLISALRFGTPEMQACANGLVGSDDKTRLRFLIDRHLRRVPSVDIPGGVRWFAGVMVGDLRDAYNDLLAENSIKPMQGAFADRRAGESDADFLARIHGWFRSSLKAGVAPVVSLRTFKAVRDRSDPTAPVRWEPGPHHYGVVTRVPDQLREGVDAGFGFDLIDPDLGKVVTGFAYPEPRQPFRALKGADLQAGEWLSGKPFLSVQVPAVKVLQPTDVTYADRVVIVINYVIGDFAP